MQMSVVSINPIKCLLHRHAIHEIKAEMGNYRERRSLTNVIQLSNYRLLAFWMLVYHNSSGLHNHVRSRWMEERREETKLDKVGWGGEERAVITKNCVTPTIELRSPWRHGAMLYCRLHKNISQLEYIKSENWEMSKSGFLMCMMSMD